MPAFRLGLYVVFTITFATSLAGAALEVIGSGYPRTGTDSLRAALNSLGYKTYHMKEIIDGQLSQDVPVWHAQAENDCSDIDALRDLFEKGGWTAAVDFPASLCYESLMKAFPDAKVIHTERKSSEQWWDSASNTVLVAGSLFPFNFFGRVVPFFKTHRAMCDAEWNNIVDNGKRISMDEDNFPHAYKKEFIEAYERNNARVRKVVPRKRLLIQDHSNGWTDLCRFLEKEVPDIPYPYVNNRAEFYAFVRNVTYSMTGAFIVAVSIFAFAVKKLIGVFVKHDKVKRV